MGVLILYSVMSLQKVDICLYLYLFFTHVTKLLCAKRAHDCALGSRDGYIYIYMSVMVLRMRRHVRIPAGMRTGLRGICRYVFLV